MITDGFFSIDEGEDRASDRAQRKRSPFNMPLEIMISC